MNKLSRLARHLTTTTRAGRRAFPAATLEAIQATIAQGETQHRAEIRIIIEPALGLLAVLRGLSSRHRARELFSLYHIWDTEENCGVLIYINLADHKVDIITDRAVDRALDSKDWHAICQTMTQGFARGEFHESAIAGLKHLNELLHQHFAANGAHHNQLSNQPIVL